MKQGCRFLAVALIVVAYSTAPGISNSQNTCLLEVDINRPLYHRYNPIEVKNIGDANIVEDACNAWEPIVNGNGGGFSMFVAAPGQPDIPNWVDSGSTDNGRLMQTRLYYTDGFTRIDRFEITVVDSPDWCTDGSCGAGDACKEDAYMHEIGHAFGLYHCEDACSNTCFEDLTDQQTEDQLPTMSSGDFSCFGVGYRYPFCVFASISQADIDAMQWLYEPGVVNIVDGGDAGTYEEGRTPPRTGLQLYAYPNPFNPDTTIRIHLDRPQEVAIRVYDLAGRLVYEVARGHFGAGEHGFRWYGRSVQEQQVTSGAYFVQIETDLQIVSRKIMLVK